MAFQADGLGVSGGGGQAGEFLLLGLAFGVAVGADVQFNDGGAEGGRRVELGQLGFDEHGDPNSRITQGVHVVLELIMARHHVEAAFGGAFLALLGHDTGGGRSGGPGSHIDLRQQTSKV